MLSMLNPIFVSQYQGVIFSVALMHFTKRIHNEAPAPRPLVYNYYRPAGMIPRRYLNGAEPALGFGIRDLRPASLTLFQRDS
jgi:hypothetical protein